MTETITFKLDPRLKHSNIASDIEWALYQAHSKLKLKLAEYIANNPGCKLRELNSHFSDWSTSTVRNYVTDLMKEEVIRSEPDEEDNRVANYYVTQRTLEEFK